MSKKEIVLSTNKNVVKQILALSSYVPKITRLIHECPGITHGDLAKEAKIEVNHLSNIMKRLENREAVSSVKTGRDKHYYLSSSGEDALAVAKYFKLDLIGDTANELDEKASKNDKHPNTGTDTNNVPFHTVNSGQESRVLQLRALKK